MTLSLYQIDAFAERLFTGNPAAVCPLTEWLPEETMQAIAAENNLAETAFTVPEGDGWRIRWFTPTVEVDLCGHATLAAAFALRLRGEAGDEIRFLSRSGPLGVTASGDDLTLDFPADVPKPASLPAEVLAGLGEIPVVGVFRGRDDFLVVTERAEDIRNLVPYFSALAQAPSRGVLVSAPGDSVDSVDFVSRCFFPQSGVDEDPVTGSAHTLLAPYWAERLGKTALIGRQISKRGGTVRCQLASGRVRLTGRARLYLTGELTTC